MPDGAILIGSFHSITTADGLVTSPYVWCVRITDAHGNDVAYEYARDIDLPAGDEHTSAWAYKIQGKDQAWPLTITADLLEVALPGGQASFEFDTGPSPQPGQEWSLNQEVTVGGLSLRILTATRTQDGYGFSFQAAPTITGVGVDIRGITAYIPPSGGGGGGAGDGSLSAGVAYSGSVPEGKLTVVVRDVTIQVPGPWSIQWEPEGAAARPAPTAMPGAAACVTDAIWSQVGSRCLPRSPAPSADGSSFSG